MPAQVTHYLHSVDVCEKLNTDTQYRDAAALGALGPDILYYYKLLSGRDLCQTGVDLHSIGADALFSAFAKYVKHHPNDMQAKAYAYGFMCHWALDKTAHPYVYFVQDTIINAEKYSKKPFFMHVRIEHFLDIIMMRDKRECSVAKFGLKNCVPKNPDAIEGASKIIAFVINEVLPDSKVTQKQCKKAFSDTRRFLALANDRTGIKRFGARVLETLCFMNKTVSYFIHPFMEDGEWDYSNYEKADWVSNVSGETHDDSFFEMYNSSAQLAERLCRKFDEYIENGNTNIDFTGNYDMKGYKR